MTDTKLPPLAGGTSDTVQPTQSWDSDQQIKAGPYTVSRVSFLSGGDTVIGTLFQPKGGRARAAVVILGPVATVKEQAPMQ